MPKFLAIGYGDRPGYDRSPRHIRDEAHAQDARLVAEGAVMGVAGQPVHIRNPEGEGLDIRRERFMASDLPVAGFTLIEAADLESAIRKVSGTPCAVAHGVVEVWPID